MTRRLFFAIPCLIAAFLMLFDTMLFRLVLPYPQTLIALLLVQLVITAGLLSRGRTAKSYLLPAIIGVASLALLGVVYEREYIGHSEETVRFQCEGATLAGTLYVPDPGGPHPAIVLVHGSGRFPRRMYRYWAKNLVDLGFVVLAYDKRGVGESEGLYESENNTSRRNIEQLARDASAAVDAVTSRNDVTEHVGLMGISQGGWIAPLAASYNPHVRFLILHSGPAISVGEENFYSDLTGDEHGNSTTSQDEAERLTELQTASGFDPRPLIQQLDVAGLWLFGAEDRSIPVRKSVAVLDQAQRRGRLYEYRVFPSANHLLIARTGLLPDIAGDYWPTIVDWASRMKDRRLAAR